MRINQFFKFMKTQVFLLCPVCEKPLRIVYGVNQKLVCDSCKTVHVLELRKDNASDYASIVKDGWGLKKDG